MKKIIIAVAIVCAAVIGRGATVSWTCTNVKESGAGVSGVAYFVNAAVLAQADMLALSGKGAEAVSLGLGTAYNYQGSGGTFTVKAENAIANATLGLGDGKDYNVYLVVFDTSTITDASKFYVTEVKELSTYEGASDNANIKWGSQSTPTAESTAWHAVAAPEPTSGLLLLLGMAGLALKRKRA